MSPDDLMHLLFIAANANTPEERARVAWRANDYMWWNVGKYPVGFCRAFNNHIDAANFPKVKELWTKEEREYHLGIKLGE